MRNTRTTFVAQYPDGSYLAKDATNNGVPYPVDDLMHAKHWDSADELELYTLASDKPELSIVLVTITVEMEVLAASRTTQ